MLPLERVDGYPNRGPASTGYRLKQTFGPGDRLVLAALADLNLAVEEILQ